MEVWEIGLEAFSFQLDNRLMRLSKTSYQLSVSLGSVLHFSFMFDFLKFFYFKNFTKHSEFSFICYLIVVTVWQLSLGQGL